MDIETVKEKKVEAEWKIQEILNNFSQETGLKIDRVLIDFLTSRSLVGVERSICCPVRIIIEL
jgi:hypothetical protein